MGSCSIKSYNGAFASVPTTFVPVTFYFSRHNKNLYEISSSSVYEYSLKGKIKSYSDSAIGISKNGSIIIVGGTDSSGALTNRVFLIDPSTRSITQLPSVPKAVKEGHVLEYKNSYYLIGTTVEADDSFSSTVEEGGPLMRFNERENYWEVFSHKHIEKDNIYKCLERDVAGTQQVISLETNSKITLKNLISPGVFLYNDKIYLVGGKIFYDDCYQTTPKVFSIYLRTEGLYVLEEKIKMPFPLANPICYIKENTVFIMGGMLENQCYNNVDIRVDMESKEIFQYESCLSDLLTENYPVSNIDGNIVAFKIPLVFVKVADSEKFVPVNLTELKNTKFKPKEIEVFVKTDGKRCVKKEVDLSILSRKRLKKNLIKMSLSSEESDNSYFDKVNHKSKSPIKRVDRFSTQSISIPKTNKNFLEVPKNHSSRHGKERFNFNRKKKTDLGFDFDSPLAVIDVPMLRSRKKITSKK